MTYELLATAVRRLANAGFEGTEEVPDFAGALDAFWTLCALLLGTMTGELTKTRRDRITEDFVGNV